MSNGKSASIYRWREVVMLFTCQKLRNTILSRGKLSDKKDTNCLIWVQNLDHIRIGVRLSLFNPWDGFQYVADEKGVPWCCFSTPKKFLNRAKLLKVQFEM